MTPRPPQQVSIIDDRQRNEPDGGADTGGDRRPPRAPLHPWGAADAAALRDRVGRRTDGIDDGSAESVQAGRDMLRAMMTRFHYGVLGLLLAVAVGGACGGDDDAAADASTEPDARPPRGTMSLTWSITDGGNPAECADVGASQVTIEFVRVGEGAGNADSFNCTAESGTTIEIAVGTYDVDIDLVNGSLESLLDAKVMQNGVEVTEGGDTALDPVVFEL
jgi:hypothetical protein